LHLLFPVPSGDIVVDNMLKRFMPTFRKYDSGAWTSMDTTKGREVSRSGGGDRVQPADPGGFSSPKLDAKDKEILSLVKDRPSTLLAISDKTNIPFVECMFRARQLRQRGLLKKLSETCDANGLYLYVAGEKVV
jgi:hypothetical protein